MNNPVDIDMTYQIPNFDRSWWQFWKPRHIEKTVTMPNAKLTIGDTHFDNGTLTIDVHADPVQIANEASEIIIEGRGEIK